VWFQSPTYNHCFLILPLSWFLIWQRRYRVGRLRFEPNFWAVLALPGLTLLWLLSAAMGVLEVQQLVVLTILQAALLTVLGSGVYRKFAAPFLYLYFLVPSGAILIPFLQVFTARFAVAGLHLLGIPVFSTGAIIQIPAGTFAVAEACAGLRFLIAAVAFGTFFAILNFESWWRRGLFIALSIGVPILANGLRALGLIAAAEWVGSASAAMADHILYGWIFFSLVLMALILIGQAFSDRREPQPAASAGSEAMQRPAFAPRPMLVASAVCLVVTALGPLTFNAWRISGSAFLPNRPPQVQRPWIRALAPADWHPIIVSPDRVFADAYANGQVRVDRFIAVYGGADADRNLIRSQNRDADERTWTFNSAQLGRLDFGQRNVPVKISRWFRGGHSRTIWSFLLVNGTPVASAIDAKLSQVKNLLRGAHCASAYLALSLEDAEDSQSTETVAAFLRSNGSFTTFLCRPPKEQVPETERK